MSTIQRARRERLYRLVAYLEARRREQVHLGNTGAGLRGWVEDLKGILVAHGGLPPKAPPPEES